MGEGPSQSTLLPSFLYLLSSLPLTVRPPLLLHVVTQLTTFQIVMSSHGSDSMNNATQAQGGHGGEGGHGGGGGGGHGGGHHGPTRYHGLRNMDFANYFNVAIWGIFAILVLINLPRAYSRYRHPVVRTGLRLRSSKNCSAASTPAIPGTPPRPRRPEVTQAPSPTEKPTSPADEKDNTKSQFDIDDHIPTHTFESDQLANIAIPMRHAHPRIESIEAKLHPIARYLSRPFLTTGYSYGQAAVMFIWTVVVVVLCFIYIPFTNFSARRAGWIAIGQFPIIFALGAKNGLLGFLLGVGYEKVK